MRWRRLATFAVAAALSACGGGGGGGGDISGDARCDDPGVACLAWTRSDSPAVAGYFIYFGTSPGHYQQNWGDALHAGNVSAYVVTNLSPGVRYYFAVTAYDANGQQSWFSNEVSKQMR
jgi:hypothetical protein